VQTIGKKLRTILIDILGVFLIILAGLTGWLPGPGGIPLLIAGLGLLSINHEWARRWLETVRRHGVKLSEKLFNNSPRVTLMIDLIGLLIIAFAVFIIVYFTKSVTRSAAIFLVMLGIFILLGNRDRFKKLKPKR
jgi:uncharacterized membrane protein